MIDALDAAGLLARFAALHPVAATGMGFHDHDGSWGANGPAGRAARLDWCDREEGRLIAIPVASLSADDLCDRDLALGTIRAIRFELQEVQPEAWDALHTVSVIGGGLFPSLHAASEQQSVVPATLLAGSLRSLTCLMRLSLTSPVSLSYACPPMMVHRDVGGISHQPALSRSPHGR